MPYWLPWFAAATVFVVLWWLERLLRRRTGKVLGDRVALATVMLAAVYSAVLLTAERLGAWRPVAAMAWFGGAYLLVYIVFGRRAPPA
jgi:hypothetical protein